MRERAREDVEKMCSERSARLSEHVACLIAHVEDGEKGAIRRISVRSILSGPTVVRVMRVLLQTSVRGNEKTHLDKKKKKKKLGGNE